MAMTLHSAPRASARIPHKRVEDIWTLANKLKATTISVAKVDGRQVEIVLAMPVTDDRIQIEQCVSAAQDEAMMLEAGTNWPFVILVLGEQGNEMARERIRFPGGKAPVQRPLTQDEIDRGGGAAAVDDPSSIAKFHPRESANLYGISRQLMRHTEAMGSLLVRNAETTVNSLTKQNETLSNRVDILTDRNIKQAETVMNAHSQQRLIDAQARNEDMQTEALRTTAQVLAEWLPLGLHRIARKYGLAGDSELDPMLEKMVQSFDGPQVEELQKILKPHQRAMFAEMWMKVDGRKAKKEAEAKAKKDAAESTVNKLTGTKAKDESSEKPAEGEKAPAAK